mgnify:FL=1
MHKGHYGEYSGNAKHSKVTASNMGATKKDDEAHMDYLKQDVKYDNKHGHSDEKMTADEKHISKLAGDLKYDEKKQGSPAKHTDLKSFHIHSKSSYAEGPQKIMQNPDGSIVKPKNKPLRSSMTSTKGISEKNTSKLKNAFKAITKK